MTACLSLWRGAVERPRLVRCASQASEIVEAVAAEYGLTLADLRKPGRSRRLSWPRQHAMWALHKTGRHSSTAIGMFLGGLDHSTVLYGIGKHAERMGEGA